MFTWEYSVIFSVLKKKVKVAVSMQPHYFPPTYSTLCIYELASSVRALAGLFLSVFIRACASPSLLTEQRGERARSRRDSTLMRVQISEPLEHRCQTAHPIREKHLNRPN